jgi:hypothetical protein
MDINGNIKHFKGIQREDFCPIGVCAFLFLSEADGRKLAQAVESLESDTDREVQIKFAVTAYSPAKYVTASIRLIGKDVFITETEVEIDAWEAFTETSLVSEKTVDLGHARSNRKQSAVGT